MASGATEAHTSKAERSAATMCIWAEGDTRRPLRPRAERASRGTLDGRKGGRLIPPTIICSCIYTMEYLLEHLPSDLSKIVDSYVLPYASREQRIIRFLLADQIIVYGGYRAIFGSLPSATKRMFRFAIDDKPVPVCFRSRAWWGPKKYGAIG